MEGRSAAVAEKPGAARSIAARPYLVVSGIWVLWAGAVVAIVGIGILVGAYTRARAVPGTPLFPFFSWDYGWYEAVAHHGYPAVADRRYAFFPLWPWLIRASGSVPDWQVAGAVAVAASGLAFLGVAAELLLPPLGLAPLQLGLRFGDVGRELAFLLAEPLLQLA